MAKVLNREIERQKMLMDFIDNRVNRLLVEIEAIREFQKESMVEISEQVKTEEIQFEERFQKWIESQHRFAFIDSGNQEGHKKTDSDGMEWFDTKEDAERFTKLQGNILVAIEEEEHSYQEVLRVLDSIRNYYVKKGNDLLNSQSIQEVAKFGALLE